MIAGLDAKCDIKIERLNAAADATVSAKRIIQKLERKLSFRMIELLGFFTAIITLILTTVQNITSTQSVLSAVNESVAESILPDIFVYNVLFCFLFCIVLIVVFGCLIIYVKSE